MIMQLLTRILVRCDRGRLEAANIQHCNARKGEVRTDRRFAHAVPCSFVMLSFFCVLCYLLLLLIVVVYLQAVLWRMILLEVVLCLKMCIMIPCIVTYCHID